MTDETTTEQLAEIDRDMAEIDRQVAELVEEAQQADYKTQELPEYTPPDGWRVVPLNEPLKGGDEYHAKLDRYIRRVEPQPQPQPESDTELQAQVAFLKGREVTLGTRLQQEREVTTRLRHELKTVQNQLAAVKAELASVAADRQQLRVELDAAQQVPADSPEIRQLRADLAEVTQDRDTYRHAHELLLNDVNATHQRTKAMTVEAIAEWLEPVRLADSAYLANATLQHLPQIMRHLTGLDSHAID